MLPTHDASKVKASGPGLNTTGVPASLPVEFTIDAKDAGEGLLAVQITVSRPHGWPPAPAVLQLRAQGRRGRGGAQAGAGCRAGSAARGSWASPALWSPLEAVPASRMVVTDTGFPMHALAHFGCHQSP